MKLGYSMFSFSEKADLKNIFSKISQMKYDGVEPVLSEDGYLNPEMAKSEVLEIKKIADANGLEIPSVGVWSLWANNPEKVPYDAAYDRAYELFSKLEKKAGEYKVSIGIENVWNKFLLSPLEIKKFLEDINSEYVGAYFDIGNVMYIGDPSDYIRILGKYIKKIHVSDYRVNQNGLGAFVDIFAGDVDFVEVMKAIKSIAYNDYLTLEMLPNYSRFPELSIYSNKPAMDKLKALYEAV